MTRYFEVVFYLSMSDSWKVFTTYRRKADALALAVRMRKNGDTVRVIEVRRTEVSG